MAACARAVRSVMIGSRPAVMNAHRRYTGGVLVGAGARTGRRCGAVGSSYIFPRHQIIAGTPVADAPLFIQPQRTLALLARQDPTRTLQTLPQLTQHATRSVRTKSAAKKRFRVTGKGNLKRWKANKRHINSKWSRKVTHRLGSSQILRSPGQKKAMKRLLGM